MGNTLIGMVYLTQPLFTYWQLQMPNSFPTVKYPLATSGAVYIWENNIEIIYKNFKFCSSRFWFLKRFMHKASSTLYMGIKSYADYT